MMKNKQKLWQALFALYAAVMLYLLFARGSRASGLPYWEDVQLSLNLVPAKTLRLYWGMLFSDNPGYVREAVINLCGNVVMFVPLGFLLPRVFPRLTRLGQILLATLAIMTVIETAQCLTLRGFCDVDDLILNTAGAALGYGIHKLLRK